MQYKRVHKKKIQDSVFILLARALHKSMCTVCDLFFFMYDRAIYVCTISGMIQFGLLDLLDFLFLTS